MMLQEDFDSPLSKLLALYACVKDLENTVEEPQVEEEELKDEEEGDDEDVVWIFILNIRNVKISKSKNCYTKF